MTGLIDLSTRCGSKEPGMRVVAWPWLKVSGLPALSFAGGASALAAALLAASTPPKIVAGAAAADAEEYA